MANSLKYFYERLKPAFVIWYNKNTYYSLVKCHMTFLLINFSATARILNRLKTHNTPLKPPPVNLPQPPVPEVSVAILEEKPTLMYILNADLKVLCNHARYNNLFEKFIFRKIKAIFLTKKLILEVTL